MPGGSLLLADWRARGAAHLWQVLLLLLLKQRGIRSRVVGPPRSAAARPSVGSRGSLFAGHPLRLSSHAVVAARLPYAHGNRALGGLAVGGRAAAESDAAAASASGHRVR